MIGAGLMGFLADVMDVGSAMTANAAVLATVSLLFARFASEPHARAKKAVVVVGSSVNGDGK